MALQASRADWSGGNIAKIACSKEVELIDHLAHEGNDGVIGIQARKYLARLPKSVYWAAPREARIERPVHALLYTTEVKAFSRLKRQQAA